MIGIGTRFKMRKVWYLFLITWMIQANHYATTQTKPEKCSCKQVKFAYQPLRIPTSPSAAH